MADVGAAELGEAGLDVVEVKIALVAKHRVVSLHGVALGEHEAVAVGVVRVLRVNAHVIEEDAVGVEGHEGVDHRHVAADVAAGASHDDIDAIAAKVPTQGLKLFDSCHFYSPRR